MGLLHEDDIRAGIDIPRTSVAGVDRATRVESPIDFELRLCVRSAFGRFRLVFWSRQERRFASGFGRPRADVGRDAVRNRLLLSRCVIDLGRKDHGREHEAQSD